MTGAFGNSSTASQVAVYAPELLELATEKNTAFFDMYAAWDEYMDQLSLAGQDVSELYRDSVHANSIGKQTLARIFSQQLAVPSPVPEPTATSVLAIAGVLLTCLHRTRRK